MIQANFSVKAGTDEITKVEVSGHAGFDAYGYDIVCASVSALLLSTINALEDYVGLDTQMEISEDVTSFEVVAIDEYTQIQAQTLMHALQMGIAGLAEEYGDFVRVSVIQA